MPLNKETKPNLITPSDLGCLSQLVYTGIRDQVSINEQKSDR